MIFKQTSYRKDVGDVCHYLSILILDEIFISYIINSYCFC
jgi:hypothetical protein